MTQRVKRAERLRRQNLRAWAEFQEALGRPREEGSRLDLNPQEAVELLDHMEEQERYAHLVPDGECRCECHSCEIDDSHHGPGEGDCQKAYVPKPVS